MYDALILVNGEIPKKKYWHALPYRVLISTDGAIHALSDIGLTPNIIIGDMDSIAEAPINVGLDTLRLQFPKTQILFVEEQETTDFEKALRYCEEMKWHKILCVGILGKFADHSVYNLSLLARFGKRLDILALSENPKGREWIFPIRRHTTLHTAPNEIISFIAFPQAKLTTSGLKWELKDATLAQTGAHSVRNRTQCAEIKVDAEGDCLCFLSAQDAPNIVYGPIK